MLANAGGDAPAALWGQIARQLPRSGMDHRAASVPRGAFTRHEACVGAPGTSDPGVGADLVPDPTCQPVRWRRIRHAAGAWSAQVVHPW